MTMQEHTVRAYGRGELHRLRELVARMGGLAERQVADLVTALVRGDAELATEVIGRDAEIDALEREIEDSVSACWRCASRPAPICGWWSRR